MIEESSGEDIVTSTNIEPVTLLKEEGIPALEDKALEAFIKDYEKTFVTGNWYAWLDDNNIDKLVIFIGIVTLFGVIIFRHLELAGTVFAFYGLLICIVLFVCSVCFMLAFRYLLPKVQNLDKKAPNGECGLLFLQNQNIAIPFKEMEIYNLLKEKFPDKLIEFRVRNMHLSRLGETKRKIKHGVSVVTMYINFRDGKIDKCIRKYLPVRIWTHRH